MTSMTIRKLDPEVKQGLRMRAARNGRSMEQEVRMILRDVVTGKSVAGFPEFPPREKTAEEMERDVQFILALGKKLPEPFDQKKFTDELWDFVD